MYIYIKCYTFQLLVKNNLHSAYYIIDILVQISKSLTVILHDLDYKNAK